MPPSAEAATFCDLPDRAYVRLTQAVTWIVDGECLDDDAVDKRNRELAERDREQWWSVDGPDRFRPHLERLAKGQSWEFAPDAAQDNVEYTLREYRAAERWLAETGQDAATGYALACEDAIKRESKKRERQARLDRLYTLLFNECVAQRVVLFGLLRGEDKREHVEYAPIPWEYFLRDVTHTMGSGYCGGKGELSPDLNEMEAFASVFSRDGDRRATYREARVKRDDALRLKALFGEIEQQPAMSAPCDRDFRIVVSPRANGCATQNFEPVTNKIRQVRGYAEAIRKVAQLKYPNGRPDEVSWPTVAATLTPMMRELGLLKPKEHPSARTFQRALTGWNPSA